MAGILAGVKIVCCGSLFGCPRYCFLINGDHFGLFQNTVFELNSGVLVRIFDNQRVTKSESRVLIRIKILHHFCIYASQIDWLFCFLHHFFVLMPYGDTPFGFFLCLCLTLDCKDLSLFRQNGEFEKSAFRRAEIRPNPPNPPFGDFRKTREFTKL